MCLMGVGEVVIVCAGCWVGVCKVDCGGVICGSYVIFMRWMLCVLCFGGKYISQVMGMCLVVCSVVLSV